MRHRDRETILDALQDWRELRKKVAVEGGENYEKPVLVKFLDTGTFEVMERDIVEDQFYVLREHKILRELDAGGRDLEAAIRDAGRDGQSQRGGQRGQQSQRGHESRRGGQQSRRGGRDQRSQRGQQSQRPQGGKPDEKSEGGQGRPPRRGRRRGRRSGRRGNRPGGGGGEGGAKPPGP